jgi:chemotaxis protein MotB
MKHRARVSGAWLLTYADLMTLLVAFFVLIVSFSVQDKAKMQVVAGSIRDAFGVTEERRYAGDVRMTGTPEARQPGNVIATPTPSGAGVSETLSGADAKARAVAAAAERRAYAAAKKALEHAIIAHPIARDGKDAITITETERGLQVLLVDTEGRAMFAPGESEPTPIARALLAETARALAPLANRIFIDGHADATGAGSYSPFDLTSSRANAARRALEEAGFPADRIAGVSGRGDAAPLYPENPYLPGNRRIEIVLEPAAPLLPEDSPF